MQFRQRRNNLLPRSSSRTCRHVQQRMPLFLDGELSARDAQAIARHLASCASCRQEQEQWRQAEQALTNARNAIPAAGDLRTGFYARLADSQAPRRAGLRIDWRLAVPTLAACGLAFGWLTARHTPLTDAHTTVTAIPHSTLNRQIAQAPGPQPDSSHSSNLLTESHVPNSLSEFDVKPITRTADGLSAAARNVPAKGKRSFRPRVRRQMTYLAQNERRTKSATALVSVPTVHERLGRPSRYDPNRMLSEVTPPSATLEYKPMALARSKNVGEAVSKDVLRAEFREAVLQKKKAQADMAFGRGMDATTLDYARPLREPADLKAHLDSLGESRSLAIAPPASKDSRLAAGKQRDDYALSMDTAEQNNSTFYDGSKHLGDSTVGGGIDLQVRDAKRGFTSGTRLVGQMQEQDGKRVLVIEAEDMPEVPPVSDAE